jgi:hypothetical protein
VKRKERWPFIAWSGFLELKTSFNFIFYFEFDYRTSRTIKRDTNSGMDETRCLKSTLKPKLSQPQMTHQLVALALKTLFPEPLSFSRKFRATPKSACWSHSSLRFRDPARRFRAFESNRCRSRSEGIYTPLSPNGYLLHSCAKTVAFAPHLSQALTPTYLNPNPTLAFMCGVIPCEKKQFQDPSCVLEHLVDP